MNKFDILYNKILLESSEDMIINESFGKTLATISAVGAMTFGGISQSNAANFNDIKSVNHNIEQKVNNNLISDVITFIKSVEGSVTDKNGNHVVYDDAKPTNKWDGKISLSVFLKSCKGTPTIGYGETNIDIIKKGKITQSEAEQLLMKNIAIINNKLVKYLGKDYNKLDNNKRIALISLYYNMGANFKKTPELIKNIRAGNYEGAAHEFLDCNKITVNGVKTESKGLTERRKKESALFLKSNSK